MNKTIKILKNGYKIEYGKGSFDDWCVYIVRRDNTKFAPKDTQYFSTLLSLGNKYNHKDLYNDFVKLYNVTSNIVREKDLKLITDISNKYKEDSFKVESLFTLLYATMIAEENKEHTKLGKRIKRLGIYQLLINKDLVSSTCNFSKGKDWRSLDRLMKSLNF